MTRLPLVIARLPASSPKLPRELQAFRDSMVGFTLPLIFLYRPALLLTNETGGPPVWSEVFVAVVAAVLGILTLSSAMSGFLFYRLTLGRRVLLFLADSKHP